MDTPLLPRAPLARVLPALLVAVLLSAPAALAQWADDPAANLTVADRPGGQTQPKLVPTPDGGFYVSWFGNGGDGHDVYLQRLDAQGVPQWQDNGIRVADRNFSSTEDYGLAIDADGHALLAYRFPDGNGVTQVAFNRVSPAGELAFDAPGVFASSDASGAASPRVAPTPDGGAVVAYTAFSSGTIVLQKVAADGSLAWGTGGVSLPIPSGLFLIADLKASADGHVIVSGSAQLSFSDRRLRAQKLDGADGSFLWGENPVDVFDGTGGALQMGYFPTHVPDDEGGAVFAWYQVAGAADAFVRVQHVAADGSFAFPQNGAAVAAPDQRQRGAPAAAYHAASGDIYVAWPEEQQPAGQPRTYGVSAQRVSPAGERQWGDTGRTLVPMGDHQASQVSALPTPDGALFAWALGTFPDPMHVDATRLDPAGDFVWEDEVVRLRASGGASSRMQGALSTAGFAAYAWADGPGGTAPNDIKAQNLNMDGTLGIPAGQEPPVAEVDQTDFEISMVAWALVEGSVLLTNAAPAGAENLVFSISTTGTQEVLVDFEGAHNPYDMTLGIPQAEYFPETGGNPGYYLRNSDLATFAPRLYIPDSEGNPFTGNFVEKNVQEIGVDARTFAASFGVPERPFSIMLIRFNGAPQDPDAWDYVYYIGDEAPQVGAGWQTYTFAIPSAYTGTLPEGWFGGHSGDLENLPDGVTWQDVISEVDQVELLWGHPAWFYLLQDFDLGVDNVRIVLDDEGDDRLTVAPLDGTVAPGESVEIAFEIDTYPLDYGPHPFAFDIHTNDPDNPVITISIIVEILPLSGEDGASPLAFELRQNYPNPFAQTSTIEFSLPQSGHAHLEVFDVTGRRVATLLDRVMESGAHRVTWDASGVASGTYVYRLQAGGEVRTMRALVLR